GARGSDDGGQHAGGNDHGGKGGHDDNGMRRQGDHSLDDHMRTGDDDGHDNGLKRRGDGTVDDSQPQGIKLPGAPAAGVDEAFIKLRGDGSVDDNGMDPAPHTDDGYVNPRDDSNAQGEKLRGDGSVDDTTY
ncbi:MAG: hypothetical protein ACRCYV_01265, partial [Aeromonas sp.]